MSYADITIRDRNPFKRWLQRRRLMDSLKVLRNTRPDESLRVLDFGGGDGELIYQMARVARVNAWMFEPTPALMAEAKEKLATLGSVVFVKTLDSVQSETFDYVFCLEVFEHLPAKETSEAIKEMHRLLKNGGAAVVGVPHELFLPALIKGLFRMYRRYGAFDASPGNILAAVRGSPPSPRPIGELSPGVPYHFHHLGFDYRVLQRQLEERFRLVAKWFSPLPLIGAAFNSEVYFLFRKT